MKDLKKVLVLIVVTFLIVVGNTEIAYGQQSLTDSCICYTDAMDKMALECIVNAPKKDSIITNQSLQIFNYKKIITKLNIIQADNEESITVLELENQKINLHLTKAKRNVKIYGAGGIAVGIIGVLLLK